MTTLTDALPRLAGALEARKVEAELMLVGGAVMSVVFSARPGTRRASALFADRRHLTAAAAEVAGELGLPPDWWSEAARTLVGQGGARARGVDGWWLRVFAPQPEYVLALKCAELGHATGDDRRAVESDVRYLLRLTGVSSAHAAMERARTYFTSRQLPADLERSLVALL